jgi:hypothetical protein
MTLVLLPLLDATVQVLACIDFRKEAGTAGKAQVGSVRRIAPLAKPGAVSLRRSAIRQYHDIRGRPGKSNSQKKSKIEAHQPSPQDLFRGAEFA